MIIITSREQWQRFMMTFPPITVPDLYSMYTLARNRIRINLPPVESPGITIVENMRMQRNRR